MEYLKVYKKNSKLGKFKAIFTVAEILTDTGIWYAVPRGNTKVEILSHKDFWSEFDAEAE